MRYILAVGDSGGVASTVCYVAAASKIYIVILCINIYTYIHTHIPDDTFSYVIRFYFSIL